ncbi:helix-turn-helix domain-containing protein [Streptomyces violaceusniger]
MGGDEPACLTQAQVGQACGYSASAVSRIESGRMRFDHAALVRFAVFLNLPLDRDRDSCAGRTHGRYRGVSIGRGGCGAS